MLRFPALFVLLLLPACAGSGPTPYQPATNGQGFYDEAIEPGRYRVTFAGNSQTSREMVRDGVLYRAAELTLEEGADYFIVVEQMVEPTTRYYTTGNAYGGWGWGPYPYGYGPYGYAPVGGWGSGTADPVTRYTASAVVVLRHGERPADDASAYDARLVRETLRPRILMPADLPPE